MSEDKVVNIGSDVKYKVNSELVDDIDKLIEKYADSMSTAQFIGVLEIVKHGLLSGK